MDAKIPVAIGIFAHNEENNLKKLLDSIFDQQTEIVEIKEIIIISSGSYDRTNEIARKYAKKDKRIKFIDQLIREGKSSAINLFIRKTTAKVLVAISSDLQLHRKAIEEISLPFLHEDVGIVGGRPVPVNIKNNPIGQEIKLIWELHHLVSLQQPKCGEMIAFRNVIRSIPKESAVDEANLEVLLKMIGYKVVYAPRAKVFNKGPENIADFLTQRRRIYVGHLWVEKKYQYKVSTMNSNRDLQIILNLLFNEPKRIYPMLRLLIFESLGRVLGWIDFHILGQNPYVWKMVKR